MPTLFDPRDAVAIFETRKTLGEIAKAAYGAQAAEIHENLIRLRDVAVDLYDPAVIFPYTRQASALDTLVLVTAKLASKAGSTNRRLQIRIGITAPTWNLDGSMLFEADLLASTWVCLDAPAGTCSNRKLAKTGLKALLQETLVFTPIA